ncbi:hypothetical protein [Xanthomonas campestris]|uniref:hypothetical protein n=1 Tax=Xanthomonas campestris TaxID=339 RepID=UPI0012905620|nr:hypothetical protein [Xanthomonas campestris]
MVKKSMLEDVVQRCCEIRLGHVPVTRRQLGQYQRIVECCTSTSWHHLRRLPGDAGLIFSAQR